MFAGTADHTCPYDRAVEAAAIIGDMVVHFESIQGEDHGYFGSANTEWFMDLVISQLKVPDIPEKESIAQEATEETIEQVIIV